MQRLNDINVSFLAELKTNYHNFESLQIINNELIFKQKKIPLYNFNLYELFNNYSLLKKDINKISDNDFFNIVELHIVFLYTNNYKDLKLFSYYLENLFIYEDYLITELQNILNNYIIQFNKLENNHNLSDKQKELLDKYHKIKNSRQTLIDDAYKRYKSFISVNESNASIESGFVNAIFLIVVVLCVGIISAVFIISKI